MAQNSGSGPSSSNSNDIILMFLAVAVSILTAWGLWFALKYVYGWSRTAIYYVLSLGGHIPSDMWGLGGLTRRYEHYAYMDKKHLAFFADAVPDTLLINGLGLCVFLFILIRYLLRIQSEHPLAVFAKELTIDTYTKQQMPLYPHLKVFWNLNMMQRDLERGILRLAENTKRFAMDRFLLTNADASPNAEPILDEERANRVFAAQMGRMLPLYHDSPSYIEEVISSLDNNEKAVLAATLPRLAACDSDVSDNDFKAAIATSVRLVEQYWSTFYTYNHAAPEPDGRKRESWEIATPPPVNTNTCDDVLRKYLSFQEVKNCIQRHAYISTFIYDALDLCRKIGVFAPPELRWLKFVDRRLWLVVHCAGSDTPFFEIAGVHSHYLYEEKAQKAVEEPKVDRAVSALVVELSKLRFTAKERNRIATNRPQFNKTYKFPAETKLTLNKPR